MNSFNKSIGELKRQQAIETMRKKKHEIELSLQRIKEFQNKILENQAEIAQIEFEIKELKSQITEIFNEHFKDE
ncbi:MAG: hypothetical protein JNL11_17465 [Bdellovibrionaceae bacterium]|nr:hypothetical protein [Pseudobdellovibrionaceae bacterium]